MVPALRYVNWILADSDVVQIIAINPTSVSWLNKAQGLVYAKQNYKQLADESKLETQ